MTAMKAQLILLAIVVMSVTTLTSVYLLTPENLCDPSNEGTDYWYEVCQGEGPIELDVTYWHI